MSQSDEQDKNPAGLSSAYEIPKPKNLGGRPLGRRSQDKINLQNRCQKNGRILFKRLLYWLNSEDPMASLGAAKLILAYGWGKPPERLLIGNDHGKPFVVATPEQVQTQEQWERLVQESMTLDVTGEHIGTS